MKVMNMELVGDGMYLMGWSKNVLQPKQVLPHIPETLASAIMEEAAEMLVSFSVKHNAWVGVAWPQLLEEMHKRYERRWEFDGIERALERMIEDGLLEVPVDHKEWYSRWLNVFYPHIVCPTNLLINTIWTKQTH